MDASPGELELAACVVSLGDRRLHSGRTGRLSTLEAKLLAFLAARPGECVSREELLQHVWGYASSRSFRAVDVAVHRLRAKVEADPAAPRNLITVQGEGYVFLPTHDGRAAPTSAPRGKVPEGLTPFIGRLTLKNTLQQAVGSCTVIRVTGPPGVGKSRLVAEVARHEPTSVWVELSHARDTGSLLAALGRGALAEVQGAPSDQARMDALAHSLDRAGTRLCVFDNADNVSKPLEDLLARWRDRLPKTTLVVTSRSASEHPGTTRLPVTPLPLPDALAMLRERLTCLGTPARDDDEALQTSLVQALDRLPLAIELAAARAATMTLHDLVARLDQPFRLLRVPGTATEGLGHAIAWSLGHLRPVTREVLTQLSVFQGAFSLAAAEAVVPELPSGAWLPDVLSELLQASLLEQIPPAPDGSSRYRLLRTVRTLAEQHLSPRSHEGIRARHANHFAHRAADLALHVGSSETIQDLRTLDHLGADLQHAFRWAVNQGKQQLVPLAWALDAWWRTRGSAETRVRMLDQALGALTLGTPGRWTLVFARGRARIAGGQFDAATGDLETVIAAAGDAPAHLVAAALLEQVGLLEVQGQSDALLDVIERARALADEAGDPWLHAMCDVRWVWACRQLGKHSDRPDLLRDTLDRATSALATGPSPREAVVGMVFQCRHLVYEGRLRTARPLLRRARVLATQEALPFQEAHIQALLATVSEHDLEQASALEAWQRTRDLLDQLGHISESLSVRARRTWVLQSLGRADEAHAEILAIRRVQTSAETPLLEYYAGATVAMLALDEADPARARRAAQGMVDAVAGPLANRTAHGRALLALALADLEDEAAAAEAQRCAREEARAHDQPIAGLCVALTSILLARRLGDPSLATGSVDRMERYADRLFAIEPRTALIDAYTTLHRTGRIPTTVPFADRVGWLRWLTVDGQG